jgi:hypothetical protein
VRRGKLKIENTRVSMLSTFKTSTPAVRRAVVLTILALLSFAFPFVWIFVLRRYAEGFGLFAVLYLIFAIPATAASLVASRRGEWRHPDGGKRLLFMLYGSPIVLLLLAAALAMKS